MADGTHSAVEKNFVVDQTIRASTASAVKLDDESYREGAGSIAPPYDPETLHRIYERSAILRPCIEAFATNVGGFGYHLKPEIDTGAADGEKQIYRSLVLEKIEDGQRPIVTPEEIIARRAELDLEADIERERITIWLRSCAVDMTFIELLLRTVRSREITGNAYWEILRNDRGEPARLSLLPSTSMRLMPLDTEDTEVQVPLKISAVTYRLFRERRRLRLYVQMAYNRQTSYFKMLGDPRIISSRTGRVFTSTEALMEGEPDARPATEVIHFDQLSTDLTDYGVPRWIGALIGVTGSREAEEANYLYFANNAIPETIIAFSGGKPAADLSEKMEQYLRDRKGNEMRWKPFIITAEGTASAPMAGGAGSPQPKITVIPLRDGSGADALFQGYEKDNAKKVQQQWRLPDLLVGRSEETNRAQADAVVEMGEQQVFCPERLVIDAVMDRLFAAKGIRFYSFCSNGPKQGDPSATVDMIVKLATVGVITPAEARELAGPALGYVFNRDDRPDRRMALAWLTAGLAVPPSTEELEAQKAAIDATGENATTTPRIQLTPSANEKIITVDEARASLGFKPIGGERGKMTLAELDKSLPTGGLAETVKSLVDTRSLLKAAREAVEQEALTEARAEVAREHPEEITVPAETFKSFFAAEQ